MPLKVSPEVKVLLEDFLQSCSDLMVPYERDKVVSFLKLEEINDIDLRFLYHLAGRTLEESRKEDDNENPPNRS